MEVGALIVRRASAQVSCWCICYLIPKSAGQNVGLRFKICLTLGWRWGTDNLDGLASRWIVVASVFFPCTIKSY